MKRRCEILRIFSSSEPSEVSGWFKSAIQNLKLNNRVCRIRPPANAGGSDFLADGKLDYPGSWLVSSAVPSAGRSGFDATNPLHFSKNLDFPLCYNIFITTHSGDFFFMIFFKRRSLFQMKTFKKIFHFCSHDFSAFLTAQKILRFPHSRKMPSRFLSALKSSSRRDKKFVF